VSNERRVRLVFASSAAASASSARWVHRTCWLASLSSLSVPLVLSASASASMPPDEIELLSRFCAE
jgi:hypothetical protein